MKKILLVAAISAFMVPAIAQAERDGVELTLKETAEQKVEQDRIKATLRFESKGRTTAYVQEKVNRAMADAIRTVNKQKSIEVSTGNYNIHQVWNDKKRAYDQWQASQTIILDSGNKEDILEVAGELQKDGFLMNGLQFYLSREKEATYKNILITKAMDLVMERSRVIANSIGKKKYAIEKINIGGDVFQHRNQPQMMRGMMAMADGMEMAKSAGPVVESSDQRISISVDVMISLDD